MSATISETIYETVNIDVFCTCKECGEDLNVENETDNNLIISPCICNKHKLAANERIEEFIKKYPKTIDVLRELKKEIELDILCS